MPKLYSYQKITDAFTTYVPQGEGIIELCTTEDGRTVISVPDKSTPVMPTPAAPVYTGKVDAQTGKPVAENVAVAADLKAVELNDTLRATIKTQSPHYQLINDLVRQRIRQHYSVEEELQLLRTRDKAPEEFAEYEKHVDECLAWGTAQKTEIGL